MDLKNNKKEFKKEIRSIELAKSKKEKDEIRKRSVKGDIKKYVLKPTKIYALDKALCGGIVVGGHIHFYSIEGLGKTNFCIKIAKTFQETEELDVYWDDTEGNFNPEWAQEIGLDTNEILWSHECYAGEEHLENIILHTMDNDISLSIVDSVDNLIPLKQLDAVADDVRSSIAHLVSRTIPQINIYKNALKNKNETPPTYLWISQVRDNQKSPQGGFTYSGGHILKHTWTQSIRISRITYLAKNQSVLPKNQRYEAKYYKVDCLVERNRAGRNGVPFSVYFDIENACFDNTMMIIEDKSRFIKNGAMYEFENIKERGIINFKLKLEENPDILDKLSKYEGE